jgi:hypothetical protein
MFSEERAADSSTFYNFFLRDLILNLFLIIFILFFFIRRAGRRQTVPTSKRSSVASSGIMIKVFPTFDGWLKPSEQARFL